MEVDNFYQGASTVRQEAVVEAAVGQGEPQGGSKQPVGCVRVLISNDYTVDQMTVTILDVFSTDSNCLQFLHLKDGCRLTLMVLPEKKFKFKTPISKGNFPLEWKKSFTFSVGNQVTI